MSLQSLREQRLSGKRPAKVALVLRDCPKPNWLWLRDDPAIVWLSPRADVRSHDLRPLVGIQVAAMLDSLGNRLSQVREAVLSAGGVLLGAADGRESAIEDAHPWSSIGDGSWRARAGAVMVLDRNFYWSLGGGNPA